MTISYSGNFCRLLIMWKGSVWRLVWKELVVFLVLYYMVRIFYRRILPIFPDGDNYRKQFELLAQLLDESTKNIPLTFLLGFYVANIVSRWWRQFECLPWPEDLLSILCVAIPSDDERSRRRRHTIARYLNLTTAIVWREISSKLRRRFPSLSELLKSGLVTETELHELHQCDVKNVIWMMPLHWVQQIMMDEIKDNNGQGPSSSFANAFIQEVKQYRATLRKLYYHDWICVPLVYTQVTSIATYAYFAFCLISRQYLDPERKIRFYELDFVVPFYTIVQFLFFIGWFKVGQDLMRPFGMDDDDIELDYIFERNVAASFAIVNRLQMKTYVTIGEDAFSAGDKSVELPQTGLAYQMKQHRPLKHFRSFDPINEDSEAQRFWCLTTKKPWRTKEEMKW